MRWIGLIFEAEGGGEAIFVVGERNAEERWARNVADAVRAAGEIVPVDEDDADDFAEGERHDGEIVAAQAQDREAEDDSPQRREETGQGQHQPEGPGHEPSPNQIGK